MAEFGKLLFDLSLYFSLSGYFLFLATDSPPSMAAFLLLNVSAGLSIVFRNRSVGNRRLMRILSLLLPIFTLLSHPSLWQFILVLPPWIYLFWSILSDRLSLGYDDFRSHFSLGIWLHFILILGLFFSKPLTPALLCIVPFFVIMLASGVCNLRILREEKPSGFRQWLYLILFILLCTALTLGKAPQLFVKVLGLFYRGVVAPILLVAAIVVGAVVYVFVYLFLRLFSKDPTAAENIQIDLRSLAEDFGLEDQYIEYTTDLKWLRLILIFLGIAAILFFLFLVFRRLMGNRPAEEPDSPWQERQSGLFVRSVSYVKPGLIRPRDPRLAVRYYFSVFLAECRHRGLAVPKGMTASELTEYCSAVFPGADPGLLIELYLPARYCNANPVSQSDVRRAAEVCRELKRCAMPDKSGAEQ